MAVRRQPDPVVRVKELKEICHHAQTRSRQLTDRSNSARRRRAEVAEQRGELSGQMDVRRSVLYTDESRVDAAILEAGFKVSGMSPSDLWLEYFALAGDMTPDELAAALAGQAPLYGVDQLRLACILS
jgi:hypothetical protein